MAINPMIKRRTAPSRATSTETFEAAVRKPEKHFFRLYIAGGSQRSLRAVKKIKEICEREIHGLYTLEIIDLYQQPARAIADQIVAAPTLVRRLPEPVRLVGDLSDDAKVMALFKNRTPGGMT
jgi:circadian clock protein KaiB